HEQGNGRVCARDQQVDTRVIYPAHPGTHARSPGHAVVESAGTEARGNGSGKHGGGGSPARSLRAENQQRRDSEGDDERHLMQYTSKPRLAKRFSDRTRHGRNDSAKGSRGNQGFPRRSGSPGWTRTNNPPVNSR